MTRRSLFAMLLGIGAAPVLPLRRPGSWFVEDIRQSPGVMTIRHAQQFDQLAGRLVSLHFTCGRMWC